MIGIDHDSVCFIQAEQPVYKVFREGIRGKQVDMIVIGPLTDQSKIVTSMNINNSELPITLLFCSKLTY